MKHGRCALLLLLLLPTATWAQSKKYPPVPPDKDTEAENRSELWEGALNPDMRPYAELVRAAEGLLLRNTSEDTKLAIAKLDEAIGKMPSEPRAYLMRGRIYLGQRNWANCAEAFHTWASAPLTSCSAAAISDGLAPAFCCAN